MNAVATPYVSIAAFEAGEIDVSSFDHRAHIYVGWMYLERYPLQDAIDRFSKALRRLTVQLGIPGKYHETITWFFLLLIAERRAESESGELLKSDLARQIFLLPDKLQPEALRKGPRSDLAC